MYTKLKQHVFVLTVQTMNKVKKELYPLLNGAVIDKQQGLIYLFDMKKPFKKIEPSDQTVVVGGVESKVCHLCEDRVKSLTNDGCQRCQFASKKDVRLGIFRKQKIEDLLEEKGISYQEPKTFYQTFFQIGKTKSVNNSIVELLIDKEKIKGKLKVTDTSVTVPIWVYSSNNRFKGIVDIGVPIKGFEENKKIVKANVNDRSMFPVEANGNLSYAEKRRVVSDYRDTVYSILYRFAAFPEKKESSPFPKFFYGYHNGLKTLSLEKTNPLVLSFIEHNVGAVYRKNDAYYVKNDRTPEEMFEYLKKPSFKMFSHSTPYVYDGKSIYERWGNVEEFNIKRDYNGLVFVIKKRENGRKSIRTYSELLDKKPIKEGKITFIEPAIVGYSWIRYEKGDEVIIWDPRNAFKKLQNAKGEVIEQTGKNVRVAFQNGYFEETLTIQEINKLPHSPNSGL